MTARPNDASTSYLHAAALPEAAAQIGASMSSGGVVVNPQEVTVTLLDGPLAERRILDEHGRTS